MCFLMKYKFLRQKLNGHNEHLASLLILLMLLYYGNRTAEQLYSSQRKSSRYHTRNQHHRCVYLYNIRKHKQWLTRTKLDQILLSFWIKTRWRERVKILREIRSNHLLCFANEMKLTPAFLCLSLILSHFASFVIVSDLYRLISFILF